MILNKSLLLIDRIWVSLMINNFYDIDKILDHLFVILIIYRDVKFSSWKESFLILIWKKIFIIDKWSYDLCHHVWSFEIVWTSW